MTKAILFCADGTWNGPPDQTGVSALDDGDTHGELDDVACTNVVKLFANLAGHVTPETVTLRNEQERVLHGPVGEPVQVAKYLHGVGDSRSAIIKLLGGAFGMGVVARIVRGYTFISRQYDPGDEIHIIGFSRGAYTARALAGMIAKVGLLDRATYDPEDKDQAYRLGIAAWARSKSMVLAGAGKLTSIANIFVGFVQGMVATQLPSNSLLPDVPMKSVAVWDTVGSMGIPLYAGDSRVDVLRFTDTRLSDSVQHGFHAMAVDELRRDFPVTRWDARTGVEQAWFIGAHGDVGGGYDGKGSYLSDVALSWMMKKLAALDVEFLDPLVHQPNPQPLRWPWHTPWTSRPFDHLPTAPRRVHKGDLLHASVVQRWNAPGSPAYRPTAMEAFAPQGIGGFAVDSASYS